MDFCLIAETTAAAASSIDWTAWYNGTMSVLMVAAGLGFVIFVHELGHFLAAKSCGVKCEKFYIGFDIPLPKIAGFQLPSKIFHFQWGETEYGIGILPLGGYVKMLGQDDDPRKFKEEQERIKQGVAENAAVTPVIDPRSYPAKSVPQRMLIISAGVIMNLIFGVIMGSIAYGMGVVYEPTIIGSVTPGGAAWTQDYRPGDKILRIGKGGRVDEQLRFMQDLMPQIMLNGGDAPMEVLVRRDGEEKVKEIQPSDPLKTGKKLLGIGPSSTTTINPKVPADEYSSAQEVEKQLAGATILAVNGEKVADYAQLQAIFAQHPSEALTLSLERPKPLPEGTKPDDKTPREMETYEVTVEPQHQRTLGLVLKLGPVVAVRNGSPAKTTGIEDGDVIVSIAGEPVGDPFTLSQRMLAYVGKEIDIEVERAGKDGKVTTKPLKITPKAPLLTDPGFSGRGGDMVAAEPLGLAFSVLDEVVGVLPDSPAAKAGLQAGDVVVAMRIVPGSEESAKRINAMLIKKLLATITFNENDDHLNIASLYYMQQFLPPDTKFEVTYRRGELKTALLESMASPDGYVENRGINLQKLQEVRTATGFGDALWLGFRETTDKLKEVGYTLQRLVTFKIAPTNLGGPLSIFAVARSEATLGWARLLIFLTFLSANLALLNFLPIPVLDGGHMVFLVAEWIRGKPVDENMQGWALLVGMVCLLSLMVFVFGLDIFRFVEYFA